MYNKKFAVGMSAVAISAALSACTFGNGNWDGESEVYGPAPDYDYNENWDAESEVYGPAPDYDYNDNWDAESEVYGQAPDYEYNENWDDEEGSELDSQDAIPESSDDEASIEDGAIGDLAPISVLYGPPAD